MENEKIKYMKVSISNGFHNCDVEEIIEVSTELSNGEVSS